MLVSLASESVILDSDDYRVALAAALATMIIADILCAPSPLKASGERWFAVVIAAPSRSLFEILPGVRPLFTHSRAHS